MALTHLIVIDPSNGKRVTSYVVPIHGQTYDELLAKAQADYHDYIYLPDDGSLQAQLTNDNAYWLNGRIEIRPSDLHVWDGTSWIIDNAKQAALLASRQAQVWERIKNERYRRSHSGVYVASVDKWFHTDEPSRIQYLSVQQMATLSENLQWKTMDNSFVSMTKALLHELMTAMIAVEQANFANAERHRLAMLAAANPLDYDYSTGWQEVYHD